MEVTNRRRTNQKIRNLALTACLAALIVVMAFTPIGYLKIGIVSITFIPIPVVIGAIVGGCGCGTVLGLVFGITSFIQCFGMDAFGTALMSISAVGTVILCLLPRVLMGLLCGLIAESFRKKKVNEVVSFSVTSLCGGVFNTILFVGCLILIFGRTDYIRENLGDSILKIVGALVTANALIEWAACLIIGTAVSKALVKVLKRA